MLRSTRIATRGLQASTPYIYQNTIGVENAGSSGFVLENTLVRFDFLSDKTTGYRFSSLELKDQTQKIYNYTRSLWEININRRDRIGIPTHIYPSAKYLTTPRVTNSVAYLTWENVPIDEANNFYVDVIITVSLGEASTNLEIGARLELSSNADATLSDYAIAGFHLAPLAFESFATDDITIQQEDVFSYAYKGGLAVVNPVENLRPPRCRAENMLYHATRSDAKANYIAPFKDPSSFKSTERAINTHPGMMSMPMLSYSNRSTKEGILIYLKDPNGYSGKVFQWWGDGKRINLRFYEAADSEFDNNGVAIHWENDKSAAHIFDWTVNIQPYKSPTKWSDIYSAVLYRETLTELNYIPDPLWKRAEDGVIPTIVADAPALVTSWQGTGHAYDLLTGIKFWRGHILSGNTGVADIALYNHMHTFNFDDKGEGWAQFATGNYNTSGPEEAPDYTPVNEYWSGVWPQMLEVAKTPVMPYWLYPFTIATGSNWIQEVSGYDLYTKSKTQRHLTSRNTGDIDDYSLNGSCMTLAPNKSKALETVTGLAEYGANAYRDVLGSYQIGCYAESHVYRNGGQEITLDPHPRSIYSYYWNKQQIEQLSGWSEAANTQMSDLWTGVHGEEYLSASFITDSEYFCDTHMKYVGMGIEAGPVTDRYDVYTIDTGFYPLINGNAALYQIPTPVWHQSAPLWHIVHGDRFKNHNLLGHFGNITSVTNLANYWIKSPTGLGPAPIQAVLTERSSDEHRVGILRGNLVHDVFGYGGEISITQWDPGFTFSNLKASATGWITGEYTTGLFNFGKDLIRAKQAASDYLIKGTQYYPLEDFTSDVDYVWQGQELVPKHTSRYHNSRSGEHAVFHTVRKHYKEDGKFLVALCNWTTGIQSYAGVFSPEKYGIYRNYDVYNIYYGTGVQIEEGVYRDPGDRIPVGTGYIASYDYQINPDGSLLNAGEIKLLEFVEASGRPSIVDLCRLKENTYKIRYDYSMKSIFSESFGVSYSYTSEYEEEVDDRHVGFRAPATQDIVNNLPKWMSMRQHKDSNGWKLVNSWGMELERVYEYANYSLRNVFLATSDRSLRSNVSKGSIASTEVFNFDPSRNILLNSAFSKRDVARTRLPYAWSDYRLSSQKAFLDSTEKVAGNYSVRLEPGGVISQLNENTATSGKYTFSAYLKSKEANSRIKLLVILEGVDGKTYSAEEEVILQNSDWTRHSVTATCDSQVYRYQVVVKGLTGITFIDCVQLEKAEAPTLWQGNTADAPSYIERVLPFKFSQAVSNDQKIAMWPVGDSEEFKFINVPTRLERRDPSNKELEPFGSGKFTRVVGFHGDTYAVNWVIENNKIVQKDSKNTYERFKEFDLREIRFYQGRGEGTVSSLFDHTVEMITASVYRDLLFVVTKDTHRTRTVRTVKVVVPRVPPNGEDYLESITDLEIDIPLEYELGAGSYEEISSIGFSEVDSSWMVINTTHGRRFYYKLYFDYYFVNATNRAIYTLENYGNSQIQLS